MRDKLMIQNRTHHRGVALIFSLLLLLLLTVIGVSTLSSVRMQERMAGNANLQALAFEAASAGISEAVDFWLDDDNSNWPTGASCFRGLDRDWATDWEPPQRLEVAGLPVGFVVQYQTRLGCFEAGDWVLLDDGDPTTVPVAPPVQLLALSQGLVFRSNDGLNPILNSDPIATRQIEVRLERRGGEPPDFCALNLCPLAPPPSGGDGTGAFSNRTLEVPNAQAFSIDGGAAGCAAGFDNQAEADRALAQLSENQLQRYQPTPGIVDAGLKGILSRPNELANAVNAVKIGIQAWDIWDSRNPDRNFGQMGINNPDPAQLLDLDRAENSNPFASCRGRIHPDPDGNLTSCPSGITGFHYIPGNVDMGPCTFRNFMIVEGDFLINGNPIYTEPLLVLGGTMETRGWGNSENSNIAVVQNLKNLLGGAPSPPLNDTPAYTPPAVTLDDCRFRVAGGGTGALQITPNCNELQQPWEDLNSCLNDLAEMSRLGSDPGDLIEWNDGTARSGSLFDYIEAIINHGSTPLNLNFGEIDLVNPDDDSVTLFSVPNCAGDPLAAGRRNVIASWREFIDTGRWDAVAPW